MSHPIPEPILERLQSFDVAMLVTRSASGILRARPMSIVEHLPDRMRFVTDADTGKVMEVESHAEVMVSLQSSGLYVSFSGHASLQEGAPLVDELWNESWRVWFPRGPRTPGLLILDVIFERGEFWDHRGTNGLAYLWEAGRAWLNGEAIDGDALPDTAHGVATAREDPGHS